MRYKFRLLSGVLICIIGLVFSVNGAAAQSEPETIAADDGPATTEVSVEEVVSLEAADVSPATVAVKDSLQSAEKGVPSDADEDQEENQKRFFFLPFVANGNTSDTMANAAEALAFWRTIRFEGYEGIWPNTGWRTFDCNGSGNGTYFWDDENWIAYSGSWSAWPAGNRLNPRIHFYPNNACSWMIYGPFSLRFSQAGRLLFKYWNQSEINFDWIGWYVSCDGSNFFGTRRSGNSSGWRSASLSLNRCLGDSTVWIGYKFTSDHSIVDDGPFIDNVSVQEFR